MNLFLLSRPQYNHIREESNLSLLDGQHQIMCNMGYHPIIRLPNEDFTDFIVGARCTFVFFTNTVEQEVVGYSGEVLSGIAKHDDKSVTKSILNTLTRDTFHHFRDHVCKKFPFINDAFIPVPNYQDIVETWLSNLDEQGFYS